MSRARIAGLAVGIALLVPSAASAAQDVPRSVPGPESACTKQAAATTAARRATKKAGSAHQRAVAKRRYTAARASLRSCLATAEATTTPEPPAQAPTTDGTPTEPAAPTADAPTASADGGVFHAFCPWS